MRYLRGLFKVLTILLAVLVVTAMFLPASTTVTRSIIIQASPEQVFRLVNGFQKFNLFSPWYHQGPQTHYSYSGPPTGVGARMQWHSEHHKLGSGSRQIIAIDQNRRISMSLRTDRYSIATSWFELQSTGLDTRVTWGLQNDAGFDLLARYFNLLLDYFAGEDYQQGLRQLKVLAEAAPDADSRQIKQPYSVQIFDQPYTQRLLITAHSADTIDAIAKAIALAYSQLKVAALASGLSIDKAPYIIQQYSQNDRFVFTAGVSVVGEIEARLPVGITLELVAATQLACGAHNNDMADTAETYQRVTHWIVDNGYLVSGASSEQHALMELEPMTESDYRWICFPVVAADNAG